VLSETTAPAGSGVNLAGAGAADNILVEKDNERSSKNRDEDSPSKQEGAFSHTPATRARRSDVMTNPVLIVGAGPTGLRAALELSRMGVAVRLIDKREAPATTSRAIGVQARTLELFEQRGLTEEMVRLGNRRGGR
jgi:NADPH-dependent 2,4-dienoyl-CoA reductase/sulfur reductase-like enzyme